jgi:hypothetical protein
MAGVRRGGGGASTGLISDAVAHSACASGKIAVHLRAIQRVAAALMTLACEPATVLSGEIWQIR